MQKLNRVLLKLSGESLAGGMGQGISSERLNNYIEEIAQVVQRGVQVAIVIGGGNIFRGLSGTAKGVERVTGDQMGMLATVINSLALRAAFQAHGCKAEVFTSIRMEPVGKLYSSMEVRQKLDEGYITIIAGGTGNPYFTTDTASALRAVEIGADALLKGTRVDGVYTADPEKDATATRFDRISFDEVYRRGLSVMDLTAMTLCRENNLPIMVFDMDTKGNLLKLISGENIATLVSNDEV
ncbi:UMP kinase [Porphyromonas circumdentaria]|uniref:Uridylate kinase n=1 Tax=Porphyromonas circumdentaria TaxID=29524 RepID=A0A1T4M726_9PORP|nr:UMP kinase [Porphyromonas circumdentaria]MBB6275536.1 uridylate kinase [Porphyromonas circumdentaria]MDO4722168.1 UMP kinase [Porphyromonas circumdentaria]SJZ62793.1 uridylate kinase [Porphyromonas circumdentaria]